jgi:hypothetical protein
MWMFVCLVERDFSPPPKPNKLLAVLVGLNILSLLVLDDLVVL